MAGLIKSVVELPPFIGSAEEGAVDTDDALKVGI